MVVATILLVVRQRTADRQRDYFEDLSSFEQEEYWGNLFVVRETRTRNDDNYNFAVDMIRRIFDQQDADEYIDMIDEIIPRTIERFQREEEEDGERTVVSEGQEEEEEEEGRDPRAGGGGPNRRLGAGI